MVWQFPGRVVHNPNGGSMSIANALPKHLRPRRKKVFGLARGFPHDRNARVRTGAFVLAWNASTKGQSPPPISVSCTRSCGNS